VYQSLGADSGPATVQMSCERQSLELRPKTSETVSGAYKCRKTVPNGGEQPRSMRTDEQPCLSMKMTSAY